MRAVRCEALGRPSALVIREIDDPSPGPGEALVDVTGASLNFPDALLVQGQYQVSIPPPFTPGSEFAGVVARVGPGVTSFKPGDRVMGAVVTGAFAERIAVPAESLAPIPDRLGLLHAAAGTVASRTAFHALVTIANLKAGEHVVVLGASGGVGSACIQIAARLGGRVIAVVSSGERAQWSRERGAVETIVHTRENVKERLKALTGEGAHVVVDTVGGVLSEQALRATRWGGRYVVVGFASRTIPSVPLNLVLLKGVILRGFELRTLAQRLPATYAEGEAALGRLIADGLEPPVHEVISLDEVPAALERMLEHRVIGKIVVDTSR